MNGKKILVVDDDLAILDALGAILEREGYTVELLPYGERVFENIGNTFPDLIILDVNLGEVKGSLICNLITTTETLKDIPIIMISADHQMRYILAKTCPQSQFIEKPFDIDTLLGAVRERLG